MLLILGLISTNCFVLKVQGQMKKVCLLLTERWWLMLVTATLMLIQLQDLNWIHSDLFFSPRFSIVYVMWLIQLIKRLPCAQKFIAIWQKGQLIASFFQKCLIKAELKQENAVVSVRKQASQLLFRLKLLFSPSQFYGVTQGLEEYVIQ